MEDWLFKATYDNYYHVKNHMNNLVNNLSLDDISKKSTRGNNSKQYNINYNNIENIINDYSYFLDNITQLKEKLRGKKLRFKSAWLVEGQKGGYHTLHQHNPSKDDGQTFTNEFNLATVLYLDVPKHNSTDSFDLEGDFYFLTLKNDYIKKNVITPIEGDLMIMPSYMWHGTYPQKEGLRRTLNIDFEVFNEN